MHLQQGLLAEPPADQNLVFLPEHYLYLVWHYRFGYNPQSKSRMIHQVAFFENSVHAIS